MNITELEPPRKRTSEKAVRPRTPPVWHDKLVRMGYLIGAVLLHLIVFFFAATIVIWKAPPPNSDVTFRPYTVKVPTPPPPLEPAAGDAAVNPNLEPDQVVVPVVSPQSVISTTKSDFAFDASSEMHQTLSQVNEPVARGAGMSSGSGDSGAGVGRGLFGSFTGDSRMLQGTIYDLKIDPKHKQTEMNQQTYTNIVHNVVLHGWDQNLLTPYYKASKSLYTPAIWIPTTPSPNTAIAMNLSNELTPTFWVGWYHAKITPAHAGKFHFVGFGDDILVVSLNGNTVLDGSLWPVTPAAQKMPWPYSSWSRVCTFHGQDYGKLRVGDSFVVNSIESVTIDILMGDEPGGWYGAFLLIADDSKNYPVGPAGVPLYPIFQIGFEPINHPGDQPPHSPLPESWSSP